MINDPLFVQFIYYFNIKRDYYECHDVMEHVWLEEGRSPLYQGLLQIAVGLYHHENDNINGAVKIFTAGLQKLARYEHVELGIDLLQLQQDAAAYRDRLVQGGKAVPFQPFPIRITDQRLAEAVNKLKAHPPQPLDEYGM